MTYVFDTFLRRKLQVLSIAVRNTLSSSMRSSLAPTKYVKRVRPVIIKNKNTRQWQTTRS